MEENKLLDAVMRTLGSAYRAVRLYPPGTDMTMQAVSRACDAVEEYIQAEPALKLDVVRGGFILRGLDGVLTAPGVDDLAGALGSHGVGELHFVAPPTPEEALQLLLAAQRQAQELLDAGGIQSVLDKASVGSIRIVALILSKIETPPEIPEEDADKFLAELAADPGRLAVWLRSLLASDDEGLTEGILTLASAADDVESFGRTLAASFLELDTDEKDRLLEISITLQPIHDVMVEMLANLTAVELTAAIRGGCYGRNLMSLSFALSKLPVGPRSAELLHETVAALRSADAQESDVQFLEQMVGLRQMPQPETPLEVANPAFRAMLAATQVPPEEFDSFRRAVSSRGSLDQGGVAILLYLLDSAEDLHGYTCVLGALSRSVPHLLESRDADLAMTILREITQRSVASDKPWPGLLAQFRQATETACGPRSMAAVLRMFEADPNAAQLAEELVSLGGETAAEALASAAIDSEVEGSLGYAEEVLGRRLPELLAPKAPEVEVQRAARLAEMLARDGGPRCMHALGLLLSRPEDGVRSKTARGIAAAGGQPFALLMPKILRDESSSVAMIGAQVVAQNGSPVAVQMLAKRLAEIEGEKDLSLAREIIGAMAKSPSPVAEAALREITGRGSFLRRSKDSELKSLAEKALRSREAAGGGHGRS